MAETALQLVLGLLLASAALLKLASRSSSLAALATFGTSDLFERHVVAVPKPQLAEEALELAAFGLLALGAVAAVRRTA